MRRGGRPRSAAVLADAGALENASRTAIDPAAVPATTLDELKVKARALPWCYGADDVMEFFEDIPNATDTKLVRSIIRDLLAA